MPKPSDDLTNQTEFATTRPMFEQTLSPIDPSQAGELPLPIKPQRKWLAIGGGVSATIVVVSMMLLWALSKQTANVPPPQSQTTPSPVIPTGPYVKRILQLEKELTEADPTKQSIAFPPVDLSLRLEAKQRR